MGENNNSIFDKMLLKNIDEDVNLIDKPAENSPSTARLSTVTKVKNYIDNDKQYDERAEI